MPVLSLLKVTLSEKLEVIRALDTEVVELIDDEEALVTEIQQADAYREEIHSQLLRIEAKLATLAVTTPPHDATPPTAAMPTVATTTVKLP